MNRTASFGLAVVRLAVVSTSHKAAAVLLLLWVLYPRPSGAVPIFAERYGFRCTTCHSAVPELNTFGESFRRAGFQLPPAVPRHKEFPLALRFQETYVKDLLPAQSRRFNALGLLISTANFGSDRSYSYFARYILGSQGAAGSLYYAWAQHVTAQSGAFERLGLFGLPLISHPSQRLDTITPQAAYTYTVGHSGANLATPRLGALLGQRNDRRDVEVGIAFDEYHGAAYGAPAPPSDLAQSFSRPEIFVSATFSTPERIKFGGLLLDGRRTLRSRSTGSSFDDHYDRQGLQAAWTARSGRFDLVAQQLWGSDDNGDGFGNALNSSGGFVTAKYRPSHNAYVALRYDAAAAPFAMRDYDVYAVWGLTTHARLVIEQFRPFGSSATNGPRSTTSVQLLFALPFEKRSP